MTVSVISPVYNSAPYICACIDSLKAQTFPDFEVIFVDDHGDDNSIALARAAVADDPRFRFLETPCNSGPGIARNVGLDAAEGQYVAFIDSDDCWHPNFLNAMVEKANSIGVMQGGRMRGGDLVYCQLRYRVSAFDEHKDCSKEEENGAREKGNARGGIADGEVFRNPVVADGIFDAEKKRDFMSRFQTFSVCFLYYRRFLEEHGLRFPAGRSSEDTHFLVEALLYAERIACVDEPYYIYCLQPTSLTQRPNATRHLEKIRTMAALISDAQTRGLYAGDNVEILDYLFVKKGYALSALNYLRDAIKPTHRTLYELRETLDRTVPHWRNNPLLRADRRIRGVVWLLHTFPRLCTLLLPLWLKKKL